MDVARPRLDGLAKDFVHQADDRSFLRGLGVFRAVPFQIVEHLDAAALFLLRHQIADRLRAHTEVFLDELRQLVGQRHDRNDARRQRRAQRVDGVQVERVAGGHNIRAFAATDRENAIAMDELQREVLQQRQVYPNVVQVDVVHAQRVPDRPEQLLL